MKKTLLIFVLSISAHSIFAQQDSILKNFKYRTNYYRAINFTLGASGQVDRQQLTTGISTNSGSSGNFGGNFFSTKSTDRVLRTMSAYLTTRFDRSKYENGSGVNKYNNYYGYPIISITNQWFNKNEFIELGADISGSGSKSKNNSYSTGSNYKSRDGYYQLNINTGIGRGRLENITNMQSAIWLYKALETANSLSRPLLPEELDGLGRAITAATNTRVLDFRKRTQFILETMDGFLQQKGLIKNADIHYFSNLNDLLFMPNYATRLSGTEKFIRFRPGISGSASNQNPADNIDEQRTRFTNKSLTLSTGINKYTAQNLVHQNNYGASFKLVYNSLDFSYRFFTGNVITSEMINHSVLKQAGVYLFYEHAIYPNTRTAINFNLQTQGGYQDLSKATNLYGSISLTGTATYFISYRTSLTGSLVGDYQKNMYYISQYLGSYPDNLRLNASVGVNISM
jgi:hypothetical protein